MTRLSTDLVQLRGPHDTEAENLQLPISDGKTKGDNEGTIALCPFQSCGFRCCEFQQGNYIVMYPGELETAHALGESTAHLEVLDAYHGGHKMICKAGDTATCDRGYKPLDCQSYPFFPTVPADNEHIEVTLKGSKCPLTTALILDHRRWVGEMWNWLARLHPGVTNWLRQVKLVGYETIPSDNLSRR